MSQPQPKNQPKTAQTGTPSIGASGLAAQRFSREMALKPFLPQMETDLNRLVELLTLQVITSSVEKAALAIVSKWAAQDTDQTSGNETTIYDEFLKRAQLKTFARRSLRTMWVPETMSVFDGLSRFDEENAKSFQALVRHSKQWRSATPNEPLENAGSFVGKRMITGGWAALKFAGTAMTMAFDGVTTVTSDLAQSVLDKTGSGIKLARPFQFNSKENNPYLYMPDNYKAVDRLLADRLGVERTNEAERKLWLSFYEDPLPRALLNNYMDGKGEEFLLTEPQMLAVNARLDFRRSKEFEARRSLLLSKAQKFGVEQTASVQGKFLSAAMNNGTLGGFTVNYAGELSVRPGGEWAYAGEIDYFDTWDFDPRSLSKASGRSILGELKTRVGAYMEGEPFTIRSVKAKVSASETGIEWGGQPYAPKQVIDPLTADRVPQDWKAAPGGALNAAGMMAQDMAMGLTFRSPALVSEKGVADGGLTGPFYPKTTPLSLRALNPETAIGGGAVIFVNGINTSLEDHQHSGQRLANEIGKPVVGVYNASSGMVADLLQCVNDKFFDSGRVAQRGNPAVATMRRLIETYGDAKQDKGGLEIFAHSQGSLIVSEALRQASGKADISKNDVTTFGNAAYTFPKGPQYHHYVHDDDLVATFAGTTSPGVTRDKNASIVTMHQGGSGITPHNLNRESKDKDGNIVYAKDDYLGHLAEFRRLEQGAKNAPMGTGAPTAPPRSLPFLGIGNTLRNTNATGMALAKAAGSGLSDFVSEKYNKFDAWFRSKPSAADVVPTPEQVAEVGGKVGSAVSSVVSRGYNLTDRGMRALPDTPFLPNKLAWQMTDPLVRQQGNRIMQGGSALKESVASIPALPQNYFWNKADQGLRMAGSGLQQLGGLAASGSDWLFNKIGPTVQRSGTGDHPDVDPSSLRQDLLKRGGTGFTPDTTMRQNLGTHLGFDPAGARLHTGPVATAAARNLNAEAFTIGNDVFFGEGRFDPSSNKGMGLIAHELTHVGQQTGTIGDKTRFYTQRGGDEMELEAQYTAERFLAKAGQPEGLFVENYNRHYESEEGITQTDQQRLDHISLLALEEAQKELQLEGLFNTQVANLTVDISLDLENMADSEAASVWADAIIGHIRREHASQGIAAQEAVSAIKRQGMPTLQRKPEDQASSQASVPGASPLIGPSKYTPDKLYRLLDLVASGANDMLAQQRDFMKNAHGFFGWMSDKFGGVKPPPESIWDAPLKFAEQGRQAVAAEALVEAEAQLQAGRDAMKASNATWMHYLQGTIEGADKAIATSTVVRDTSFGIVVTAGAVAAAPAIAAGSAALAASAGLTGAAGVAATGVGTIAGAATLGAAGGATLRAGSNVAGQALANNGHVDFKEVGREAKAGAIKGAVDGGTAVIGMGVSGAAARVIGGGAKTVGTGVRIARGVAGGTVSGGISGGIGAAVPQETAPGAKPETSEERTRRIWSSIGFGALGGGVGGGVSSGLTGKALQPPVARQMMAEAAGGLTSGALTAGAQEEMRLKHSADPNDSFNWWSVAQGGAAGMVSSALPAGARAHEAAPAPPLFDSHGNQLNPARPPLLAGDARSAGERFENVFQNAYSGQPGATSREMMLAPLPRPVFYDAYGNPMGSSPSENANKLILSSRETMNKPPNSTPVLLDANGNPIVGPLSHEILPAQLPSNLVVPSGSDKVWVNTATKIYHDPESKYYGKTKHGEYMTEEQALMNGARPAIVRKGSQASKVPDVKAEITSQNAMEIPEHLQDEFNSLIHKRDYARTERDETRGLGVMTEKQQKRVKELEGKVSNFSRQIGEMGATAYMEKHYPNAEPIHPIKPDLSRTSSRSGEFDQVWRVPGGANGKDQFIIVEAKGGGGTRGTKDVEGVIVEQGTKPYLEAMIEHLKNAKGQAGEVGKQLALARDEKRIQYIEIRVPIRNTTQGHEVGKIITSDYDID